MNRDKKELKLLSLQCPDCGSGEVETHTVLDKFPYGTGARAIELEAVVPVRVCVKCGFEYTDAEAEDLRHEAVCHHLGRMTPAEIIALRRKYPLTRAQFAEKSSLGEASLARWETGELIQTAANNNLLFLLSFPENLRRLERLHEAQAQNEEKSAVSSDRSRRFRVLDRIAIKLKCEEAVVFQL